MNVTMKLDVPRFNRDVERIARTGKRTVQQVVREQSALFTHDAIKLTPPFGNAPIEESYEAQRTIGMGAVARDIQKVFKRVGDLRMVQNKPGSRVSKRLRQVAAAGDVATVAAILSKTKMKFREVLPEASPDIHQRWRDKAGRVRRNIPNVILNGNSLAAYIHSVQQRVMSGKSGWSKAVLGLRALGRRVKFPAWLMNKAGAGVFAENSTDKGSTVITVGNSVPHIQHFVNHVEQRAWANRLRNIAKQAEQAERWARKAAREEGIQV